MCEKKFCDKKCLKCKYHTIVPDPDPDDWFNDDDMAMYCTNPDNSMERNGLVLANERESCLIFLTSLILRKVGHSSVDL